MKLGREISLSELRIQISRRFIMVILGSINIRNVSISAIIGENGSGKSTLVEFLLKMVNNMAAVMFGGKKLHPRAGCILFISEVYGDLFCA